MKKAIRARGNTIWMLLVLLLSNAVAFAEDPVPMGGPVGGEGVSSEWYNSPWLWILAVIAVVLLLASAFGTRRRRTDA